MMKREDILSAVDHTLLSPTATKAEIFALCEDAMRFGTASVCIPPSYVALAKDYVAGKMKICTVVGFPNGYSATGVKVYETKEAVSRGADEIDMVINLGWLKDKRFNELLSEIKAVRGACEGKILKVIVETCLLTEEEKIRMCGIVSAAGADYIKTSTGFSKSGATLEDIRLFAKHKSPNLKIKAAGGISSFEDAEAFLQAGAERLGTSRLVRIAKESCEEQ